MSSHLSENDIQKQILDYLTLKNIFHWRQNTGGMVKDYETKSGEKKKYFVKFGKAGISDILGCHRGKMFAVEVKRPGGKATDNQKEFQRDLVRAGGIGIICWSFKEFVEDWNSWNLRK